MTARTKTSYQATNISLPKRQIKALSQTPSLLTAIERSRIGSNHDELNQTNNFRSLPQKGPGDEHIYSILALIGKDGEF